MPFSFQPLEVPEIVLIQPRVFHDSRGAFLETYKYTDFARAGIDEHFVQDNFSRSMKGTLRGLHYQKNPHAQGKLVWCVRGKIYDVAVDMRKGSPSYGKWIGIELSEENNLMVYIPPAFAHGFLVLSEAAEVMYKCTAEYAPEFDRGIIWNDADINIPWPMKNPILSDKDARHPSLRNADNNFSR